MPEDQDAPQVTIGPPQVTIGLGGIVHYRLESGPNAGELRPAIVVRVWSARTVQLQVFTDGTNDQLPCPYWATSRLQGNANGQWQWPQQTPEAHRPLATAGT